MAIAKELGRLRFLVMCAYQVITAVVVAVVGRCSLMV
jgi:hypothetical protein